MNYKNNFSKVLEYKYQIMYLHVHHQKLQFQAFLMKIYTGNVH